MSIIINYRQQPAPGYTPRRPLTLHNVEAVYAKGPYAIEVWMKFTDHRPTHDHVASVTVRPETED